MLKNKIIIYVGDRSKYLAECAGPTSQLLDFKNYLKFLEEMQPGIYHTSHADLGKITNTKAPIYDVLNIADEIKYCPPDMWSGADTWGGDGIEFQWTNTKYLTEYFLTLINNEKNNVSGLPDCYSHICDKYLELENKRSSVDPCIFASGCSITSGVGVNENQTFSYLISKKLNKELVMLAKGGSGLEFQKDQILRSDILSGDIVLWGLTEERRRLIWTATGPMTAERDYKTFNETGIYLSVTSIFQVINFCRKIGAHLILVPAICSETLRLGLTHIPEFLNLPYRPTFSDYGTDGYHPGPLQHKKWADYILEKCFAKNS
jgi:hypothetical protein